MELLFKKTKAEVLSYKGIDEEIGAGWDEDGWLAKIESEEVNYEESYNEDSESSKGSHFNL